jgi:hypothetical protein
LLFLEKSLNQHLALVLLRCHFSPACCLCNFMPVLMEIHVIVFCKTSCGSSWPS